MTKTAERPGVLGTEWLGYANCVSVFVLTGRLLFCTGKPGCTNCVSVFALTGGEFFAVVQRGSCALRSAGDCRARGWDGAVPTAVGKKEGTPAVSLPL